MQTQGACAGGQQQVLELEKKSNDLRTNLKWVKVKEKKRQTQEFSISNSKNNAFINWYQEACIHNSLPGNHQLWRFEGKWPLGSGIWILGHQRAELYEELEVWLCCMKSVGLGLEVSKSPFQVQRLSVRATWGSGCTTGSYYSSIISACMPPLSLSWW